MKRSEINKILRETIAFLKEQNYAHIDGFEFK